MHKFYVAIRNRRYRGIKHKLWPTIIKYTRSRSLFKALKVLYFNKYKSNLKNLSEKHQCIKCLQSFFGVYSHSFTCQKQKDTLVNSAAQLHYCFIPFKSLQSLHPKDLTFSKTNETELIQHAFGSPRSECPKE